jgi:hypothetical protein
LETAYTEIGVCSLSCRLCPSFHTEGSSRCGGCKSPHRMGAGCPFITCAVKRRDIEFCWQCEQADTCEKWHAHRDFGREHDTFVCYQKIEHNISFIQMQGIAAFAQTQQQREGLLREMLRDFNDGRSKRYYCIAATVMEIEDLQQALIRARQESAGLDVKERCKVLHTILDEIADANRYCLHLRK